MIRQKIVIIGAGNVAYHLVRQFLQSKHTIAQVYNRNKSTRFPFKVPVIHDFSKIDTTADTYLIAVKDDAITSVVPQLYIHRKALMSKVIAHTSGTVPAQVLSKVSAHYGVFYPLQTVSKNRLVDLSHVPLLIETSDVWSRSTLGSLASSFSKRVYAVTEKERQTIHLAAVFANNFTNHLLAIAEEVLKKEKMSFELLIPLIEETVEKIKNNSPASMQTGPAARKDHTVIKKHLQLLSSNPTHQKIYSLLTQSIQKIKYSEKK